MASSIRGSSATTRPTMSRRSGPVEARSRPVNENSSAILPTTSAEIAASSAANRPLAAPKSVQLSTIVAETMPMQTSLARVTESMKTASLAPPLDPSSPPAIIVAVNPASAAAKAAKLRNSVATKPHAAHQSASPTKKPDPSCGKHAVNATIATAPNSVPTT